MKASASELTVSIILFVALICFDLTAQQARVVGYYTMWNKALLPASGIRYHHLTHVNHAFALPTAGGGITSSPPAIDTALIGNAHRAGKKVLISLGGANSTSVFSTVVADVNIRTNFIKNLVTYVVNNHYDGADFDWEQPSSPADSINEMVLMKETREAFRKENQALLLTMAIGSSAYGGRYRNYDTLQKYVDWFNVMTYDMDQGWSGKSGYNAALYYYSAMGSDYSVDQSIGYLTRSRHIPPSQLILGLPFYGKTFNNAPGPGTTFTFSSTPFYSDIAKLTGWTRYWDPTAQVPYLSNGFSFITYDDSMSIALKCQYAINMGLGGVMIWELSQGVVGQNQPLMDAIGAQMMKPTAVPEGRVSAPDNFKLEDCFPNPCNPSTTIRFEVFRESHATLRVYDLFGREIATLFDEFAPAGSRTVRFDATPYALSSGVYFYRFSAGGFTETKRFSLTK